MRSAILQERDALIAQGKENKPRDSKLSTGKFDEDLTKVKEARIRVQRRLVDGKADNSSDEEAQRAGAYPDQVVGQKDPKASGGARGAVLHFKRTQKQQTALDIRRRRAGRYGQQGIEFGGSDDESSGFEDESSDDESLAPTDDEFFCHDRNGKLVNGQYTTEGFFLVEVKDRGVAGRCDIAGFLLDEQGVRVQDLEMGERVRVRAFMLPQRDEFICYDRDGE